MVLLVVSKGCVNSFFFVLSYLLLVSCTVLVRISYVLKIRYNALYFVSRYKFSLFNNNYFIIKLIAWDCSDLEAGGRRNSGPLHALTDGNSSQAQATDKRNLNYARNKLPSGCSWKRHAFQQAVRTKRFFVEKWADNTDVECYPVTIPMTLDKFSLWEGYFSIKLPTGWFILLYYNKNERNTS